MEITLIIPTRNRTNYLEKLIKNLEEQTQKPDEIIIVIHEDDKKTKEFLDKLSTNLPVKYFKTKGGSSQGRNVGIHNSKGELLVFIEDDVLLEDEYIENVKKIFKKNDINILAGYTLDMVDLTSPWLIRKSEVEYVYENHHKKFIKDIKKEIKQRYPQKSELFTDDGNYRNKLILYSLLRTFRNLTKSLILLESPLKGRILASGYRSEMPDVIKDKKLVKVEWFNGGNFAAKRNIIEKYPFNEEMEEMPYALNEDLELSARIGKKYSIFLAPQMKLFHLRAPSGVRINQLQKYKSIVINFNRISRLNGNPIGYWWCILGLLITRIINIPLNYSTSISEIKGIIEGINTLNI
jgi:glycosyltransferase involved in cell wall biosynthesis